MVATINFIADFASWLLIIKIIVFIRSIKTYPEQLVGKITKKALSALDMKDNDFFEGVGYYFVEFVCEFGYGDVLALLGRQLRDFLNGLDNLHEYLKYSYPRFLLTISIS